ncbi:MAG: hypothetical protein ACLFMO_02750 [Eubacteriales bacterium]
MKNKLFYISSFVIILGIGVFVGYWISSNEIMDEQDNQTEIEENISNNEPPNISDINNIEPIAEDNDEAVSVDAVPRERITPSTKLVIQHLYTRENRLVEEEMSPPYYMLDLTREQMEQYTSDYLQSPTDNDIRNEITNYELISFSSSKVVLRKVFNGKYEEYYQVYIDPEKNKIVIENPDGSIREDIDISISALPESEREALKKPGIKVYSEEEILQLIESYSS